MPLLQSAAHSAASEVCARCGHGGTQILSGARELSVGGIQAQIAGGHMISFINCNLGSTGYQSGESSANTQNYPLISSTSSQHSREDYPPPNPRITDRKSTQWGRFIRRILGSFLHDHTSGSETSSTLTDRSEHTLAPFGNSGDDLATASRTPTSKGEAYVTSMLFSGKGLALWQPRPRYPIKDGEGVMLGDVGLYSVQEGFQKIFNLWDDEAAIRQTGAAETNLYPYSIPPKAPNVVNKAEHLEGDTIVQGATAETKYRSENGPITGFEFRYQVPARAGAILAMTSTAMLEKLTATEHTMLEEHIKQHAELIYTHARTLQRIPDDEGLYIITGSMKSESWALAGFSEPMTQPGDVLRLVRRRTGRGNAPPGVPLYVWTVKGTADGYSGASLEAGSQDQCLFLQGFKLDIAQTFRSRVEHKNTSTSRSFESESRDTDSSGPRSDGHHFEQAPGPDSTSGLDRRNPSVSGSSGGAGVSGSGFRATAFKFPTPSNSASCHPCDAINRYLLETTTADFALSHDDDWIDVLKATSHPDRIGIADGCEGICPEEVGELNGSHFISTIGSVSTFKPPRHSENLSTSGGSASCQDLRMPGAPFPFSWEHKMILPPPAPSDELTFEPTGLKRALLIGIQGMAPEGAQPSPSSPWLMKKSKAKTTALSLAKKPQAEHVHMPEGRAHPHPREPLGRQLDAIEMRRALIELYGYKAENAKLLIDGENPGGLLPTKENILNKLDELVHGAQPGDSFFFHFSGQSVEKSADDTDEESTMSQVIVTYDNQTIDDNVLKEKLIARLPAGSQLTAVFDTCHSAPMLDLKHYRCNRAYVPWADKSDSTPPMCYDVKYKPRLPYSRGNASGTSASQHPNAYSIQSTASVDRIRCAAGQQSKAVKGWIHAPLSVTPSSDTSRDMWLSLEDRIRRAGICGEESPIERGSPPMDLLCQGWCKPQPNQKTRYPKVISLGAPKGFQRAWEDATGYSMTQSLVRVLRENPIPSLHNLRTDVSRELHRRHPGIPAESRSHSKETRDFGLIKIAKKGWTSQTNLSDMPDSQDIEIYSVYPLDTHVEHWAP